MPKNLFDNMLELITPEVYEKFKVAVELRRWPNGNQLTGDQLNTCMQAIVAYEYKNVPSEQRTAYIPPKETPCASKNKPSVAEDEIIIVQNPDKN